ncbi:MAG TPA: UGSC family (seleno)protein, partial [Burkholderiales bacterium]|nr:UGSC family (seleno)protein [Burkholderiales bacterium]
MSTAQLDKSKLQLEDSWEAVNAWFLERDMTDGLPIVPPTEPRVLAMTDHAERTLGYAPTDIVATLMPKRGIATIGKIAANAVMAGCKPEYMPVLIACVQAIAHPRFNLDAVQTSPHNTSALPVVNGPMRKALDLNWGYNHTGSRWHSTATIGRALRLIMANVGGTPGSVNIHTQGHIARFEHCIAENEEENPWEPLHVERGYAAEANAVTLIPACPAAMIDDNGGSQTAKDLLRTLALSIPYVGNRNTNGEGQPLLILCPQH